MNVVIAAKMGIGTIEAKLEPLSKIIQIEKIIFVRKEEGPKIDKVEYHLLPRVCNLAAFNFLLTPFIIFWITIKERPNLLIGYHIIPYAFFVSLVGLITKTPYIVGQTGLKIQDKVLKNSLLRKLSKVVFHYSYKVNCPGSKSVEFWSDQFPGLMNKFHVLHSTIDTNKFKTESKEKEYTFIYLGRLGAIKNVDLIIKSVHELNKKSNNNKFKIQIVGDGPESKQLKKLTNDLNANSYIHFKGFVHKPSQYLNNSKFLIMCSSSEGLPTAMMQGMACKTIPITNLVGNIGDLVVENETGFVFDNLDVDEISNVLLVAANTKQKEIQRIQDNCRNVILKNHSHRFSVQKWNKLLGNLNSH